jgi:hypothetical protein
VGGEKTKQNLPQKETPASPSELRALDPDLPILAARAAMQLDRAIGATRRGQAVPGLRFDAIEELSRRVSQVSASISGGTASRALVDPLTASVLSRAYAEATHAPLQSWQDLEKAASELSRLFEQASHHPKKAPDPVAGLELLRDFCVKLSEYAALKRQLAYGERPVPPHWR